MLEALPGGRGAGGQRWRTRADAKGRVGWKLESDYTECIRRVRDICVCFEGNREPQKGFRQGKDVINFESYST